MSTHEKGTFFDVAGLRHSQERQLCSNDFASSLKKGIYSKRKELGASSISLEKASFQERIDL